MLVNKKFFLFKYKRGIIIEKGGIFQASKGQFLTHLRAEKGYNFPRRGVNYTLGLVEHEEEDLGKLGEAWESKGRAGMGQLSKKNKNRKMRIFHLVEGGLICKFWVAGSV